MTTLINCIKDLHNKLDEIEKAVDDRPCRGGECLYLQERNKGKDRIIEILKEYIPIDKLDEIESRIKNLEA